MLGIASAEEPGHSCHGRTCAFTSSPVLPGGFCPLRSHQALQNNANDSLVGLALWLAVL